MLDRVLNGIRGEIGLVERLVGREGEAAVVGAWKVAEPADDADVGAELQIVLRLGNRKVVHELEALLTAPLRQVHRLAEVP